MRNTSLLALAALGFFGFLGCAAGGSDQRTDERGASSLDGVAKRAVTDRIKAVTAARGVTNPLLFAGIPNHETGLVQCWKDATWACQGPWSSDCGGPVIAGSGDGPCSIEQGGLGMYQFDAGTYAQTLATYGSGILTIDGNVDKGVDFIVDKIMNCPNTPDFHGDRGAVVSWINGATPGTADYETFMGAMAWCYNGCAPSYTGCSFTTIKGLYRSATQALLDAYGNDYWYGGSAPPPAPSTSVEGLLPTRRVGRNADGRLEVFARRDDGAVIQKWQQGVNQGFVDWYVMGGNVTSDPIVAANADGRLELFARGPDAALWHNWQDAPNGGWHGFSSMDGQIIGEPAVGTNGDGRLEVFVIGLDHQLWHRWQTSPSGAWSDGWSPMGGEAHATPFVARNADGRLEVFTVGADGALREAWQQSPDLSWSTWMRRESVFTSDLTVGQNADGRLEVFGVGGDGASIWHSWQLEPNGAWSDFAPLQGSSGETMRAAAYHALVVARNADGRLELFARDPDGSITHAAQTAPNAGWELLGSLGGDFGSDPAFSLNLDGRIELFARDRGGNLLHDWQGAPNAPFGSWQDLGPIASF